jgi:hypothetical protein
MKAYPKPPPKIIHPQHPSTHVLSTIIEGLDQLAFGDIPEVQLHQPTNNMFTTTAGSSQNGGSTSSTQKPTEVPHTNHPCGHFRWYKSSKETPSSSKSNCKTGKKKPPKTKMMRMRNSSESNRRLRGSIKNRNPS